MTDPWCPVDGCPASVCNGPHLEHKCAGGSLTSMSADNTEPCPWCGWKPLVEGAPRYVVRTDGVLAGKAVQYGTWLEVENSIRSFASRGPVTIEMVRGPGEVSGEVPR